MAMNQAKSGVQQQGQPLEVKPLVNEVGNIASLARHYLLSLDHTKEYFSIPTETLHNFLRAFLDMHEGRQNQIRSSYPKEKK